MPSDARTDSFLRSTATLINGVVPTFEFSFGLQTFGLKSIVTISLSVQPNDLLMGKT
jgi:hypothetical protein